MIFVTVGTHEQPFDRLVRFMDEMKGAGAIEEDVIIQIGYGTYEPKHCRWHTMLSSSQMQQYAEQARIVITHGGPSSFMVPLQLGKVPIVVPRQFSYGEHVNDHQLDFAREISARYQNIIVIENVESLSDAIANYDTISNGMSASVKSNNRAFNEGFCAVVEKLFAKR